MSNTIDTSKYQFSQYTGNSAKEITASAQTAKLNSSAISNALDMNDFLTLMVAQLRNQTMYDTVDNAEMLAQLAQYSSVQAMTKMADSMTSVVNATYESMLTNYISYASSLVGKEVTAAVTDESGNLVKTTGVVSGVGLFDGSPVVYIDNKAFKLANIMIVGKAPENAGENTSPDGSGEGGKDPSTKSSKTEGDAKV